MSPVLIVLTVLLILVVALAVGGYVVNGRRRRAARAALHIQAREADQHLAQAHAADNGWERTGLEEAARSAYAERHGGEPRELMLVQVIDRPGTDEDEAVFDADGERLVLGRKSGQWARRD